MCRNIVLGLRKYMIYVCYEEDAAKDNLFDISRELQENENLIADF
ncbi:MAG: hypothetical protein ACTSO7_03695 [Candidatus Heimdallarchaeota archaeon]